MNIEIMSDSDLEGALRRQAAQHGLSVGKYVLRLLEGVLIGDADYTFDVGQKVIEGKQERLRKKVGPGRPLWPGEWRYGDGKPG